ncbi:MAG: phosphoribosylformylglycinamidine synthase subunit PurS [Actinomycetota bacterium]|nr:phosphoribosylformylglycinamidine synthase subunit PurS [Actinomycetota bacterium]
MADTLKIRVLVRPKTGILDPQGEAVRRALPALGFEGVRTVHIGRLVEMEVESADEVEGMCRRLLANPTVEEYEWEVVR